MGGNDTSIGGPARNFPSTHWSAILAAADRTSPDCRASLDALLRAYWKPVYAYVRTAWGRSVDDAKDLTQSFFARLLDRDGFARLDPELGNFRGYLKRALRNFMIDAHRAESSRRPADAQVFSFDALPEDLSSIGPAAPDEPPERAYDREWFRALLEQAIDALREKLDADGKRLYFEAFRAYCIEPAVTDGPPPTYKSIAQRLGLQEWDVQNYLAFARDALRGILRDRIRAYVAGDDDVDRELQEALKG